MYTSSYENFLLAPTASELYATGESTALFFLAGLAFSAQSAQTGSCSQGLTAVVVQLLRAGVSFPVLMKLFGHTSPDMTMRYVDVALTDLQREYQLARSRPRHLVPHPKVPSTRIRAGLQGVIDSLLAPQRVLEMFRRTLPHDHSRACLDRLSNRFTKIVSQTRKLGTP